MRTTYHTILSAAIVAALPFAALAEVLVDNVTAKQRYPWNGLVDISCTVSGIDGTTNGVMFAVAAVMPNTGEVRKVSHVQMLRGGVVSDDVAVYTNGHYRLVWDVGADLGEVVFSNMVVRVTAIDLHEKVQLWAGGPYWATTNIGADEPWDCGLYFWWGDTVGYRRENNAWVASDGSSQNFSFSGPSSAPTYGKSVATLRSEGWIVTKDGTDVLAPEHDAAQAHWGGSWRMPTYQELCDLCYNKCDWTWTTQNGVNGYVVRGRGDYASSRIFLPAAGYGYGTSLDNAGSYGYYWSSVPNPDYGRSWYLRFDSGYRGVYDDYPYDDGYRCRGQSVRPVQGFAE